MMCRTGMEVTRYGTVQQSLELEVELAFDRTSTQDAGCHSEVIVRNVGVDAANIQLVEQVECVGPNFEACILTQELDIRQSEFLRGCEINIRVARPIEGVAAYSRCPRQCGRRRYIGRRSPVV